MEVNAGFDIGDLVEFRADPKWRFVVVAAPPGQQDAPAGLVWTAGINEHCQFVYNIVPIVALALAQSRH